MIRKWFGLVLALTILSGSVSGLTATKAAAAEESEGSFRPAWTIVDEGGYWGTYLYEDNSTYPGVACRNSGTTVDITLTGPWMYAHSSYYYQPVTVQWQIFKRLSTGSVQEVARSSVYSAREYDTSPALFGDLTFYDLPIGPTYIGVARLTWYNGSGQVFGYSDARYDYYVNYLNGSNRGVKDACYTPYNPTASLSPTSATVNSNVSFSIGSYPPNTTIAIRWDGTQIGTFNSNSSGKAIGSFKVPAAPMGTHKVRFSVGSIGTERTFTVIPRIKVTPSTVSRGQTVNVSLRGYAKKETVRIRWKKGSTWVQLGTILTSNTGSANIDIKVPTWATDGQTSVRGDGSYGRAQTNAVTVSGGPLSSSAEATPTPSASPSPTATIMPPSTATVTPSPTIEASPTIVVTTPEATPEATATATPTESATIESPSPDPVESMTPTPTAQAPS